jgi:hypothetical protein
MSQGLVRWVLQEEVNAIVSSSSKVGAVGIRIGESGVDVNKVPTGMGSAGRQVRNKEELVRTGSKRGSKGGGIRSVNWNSGWRRSRVKSRKCIHRSKGWKWAVGKRIEENRWLNSTCVAHRAFQRQGVCKPDFIVLFDVEASF